jgi:hypothetical protein
MWGNTIFTVSAQTDLSNLNEGRAIVGIGIDEFKQRLNRFLIHERSKVELQQAVDAAEFVASHLESIVDISLRAIDIREDYSRELRSLSENVTAQANLIRRRYEEIVRMQDELTSIISSG